MYNARNALTSRHKTPWIKPVSDKGHKTKWRAKQKNLHETRVKATHARNSYLESDTLRENNLKVTLTEETNLKTTDASKATWKQCTLRKQLKSDTLWRLNEI